MDSGGAAFYHSGQETLPRRHSPKISRARVPQADGADGSLVRNLVMTLE